MYQAILFLPLIGAIFAGLFGRLAGTRASETITTTLFWSLACCPGSPSIRSRFKATTSASSS